jgi:hypothetical protein
MDHHFQTNGSKLTGQECITKLILGLWGHMDRIWTYRNNIYHENTNQQVARYKAEVLDRRGNMGETCRSSREDSRLSNEIF